LAAPEDVEALRERFRFVYPYREAQDTPSKTTVTELKGRHIEHDLANDAALASFLETKADNRKQFFTYAKPDFVAQKAGLTAAERGTALHQAMQYIRFDKCGSAAGVSEELDRLTEISLLTQAQRETIDTQKIVRFFESEVGKRVMGARNIWREFSFSLLYDAERFYPGSGGEKILLQGVVDCFFEECGGLTVIDFKTDRVTPETLEEKAKYYEPQIAAYSEALERITKKSVNERIIYFFAIDRAHYC